MGKFLSVNLLGYILKSERLYFLEVFYHLKILGWSSGFRAMDDLPRAHSDETEFRILGQNVGMYPYPQTERPK